MGCQIIISFKQPHQLRSFVDELIANPPVHLNGEPREGDGHLLGAHDPLRRLGHDHIQLGRLLEKGLL